MKSQYVRSRVTKLVSCALMVCGVMIFAAVAPAMAKEKTTQAPMAKVSYFDRQMAKAKQGDRYAMFSVANACFKGKGVAKNIPEGIKWAAASAKAGNSDAAYRLGSMAYFGKKVKKNLATAAKWFEVAAKRGHSSAASLLGRQLVEGKGVPVDVARGVKWLTRAAKLDHRSAMTQLATLYEAGKKVKGDRVAAYMWRDLLAGRGKPGEKSHKKAVAKVAALAKTMTAAQITNAKQMADQSRGYSTSSDSERAALHAGYTKRRTGAIKKWSFAATKGDASAQYMMGYITGYGLQDAKTIYRAIAWYQKAVAAQYAPAGYALAELCWDYRVTKVLRDAKRPFDCTSQDRFKWSMLAAKTGRPAGLNFAGMAFKFRDDPAQDDEVSAQLMFARAAVGGEMAALYNMEAHTTSSKTYEAAREKAVAKLSADERSTLDGLVAAQDKRFAVASPLLKVGAKAGHLGALLTLAEPPDDTADKKRISMAYYQLAAKQGCPPAMNNLANLYRKSPDHRHLSYALLRKAARLGNDTAQNNLASRYARGRGAPFDPVLAYAWYTIASTGPFGPSSGLAKLKKSMSSQQIKRGAEIARGFLPDQPPQW